MTPQDHEYKHALIIKRKKVLRDIHWAINVRFIPIAHSQLGFIIQPMADSVPIFGYKNFPSLFLTFYIHTFN